MVLVHCNDCVCVETPKYLQHGACIAMIVFVSRRHASIYNMVLVHCNDCVCVETPYKYYNMVLVHCNDCVCVETPSKYLQHGACTLQ